MEPTTVFSATSFLIASIVSVVMAILITALETPTHKPIVGGSNTVDRISKISAQNTHIEAELKIKDIALIDKILKWAETQKKIRSETVNHIWPSKVIKTVWVVPEKATSWHTKNRIDAFDVDLDGRYIKLAISAENDIPEPATPYGSALIRKKVRDSVKLNRHWQIDITYVNDGQVPEVEIEYIGNHQNIPKHLKDIKRFFHKIDKII